MTFSPFKLYREAFSGLSREAWLLSGAIFINRAGSMVLPFLSLYLTESKGFSFVEAGYLIGCFGAGSMLGSYLGGRLTDRVGYFRVMLSSLVLSTLMFWALSQLSSFWGLAIGIFLTSVATDIFRPANYVAIDAYSKPENRTRSIGLVRFAINLGFSAGPAIGGWLIYTVGYQWLFILDGLTCLGAALWLFWGLSPQERRKELPPKNKPPAPQAPGLSHSPWQDKYFLLFLAAQLLVSVAFMQSFGTAPLFYKSEIGMTENQIGTLIGFNGLLIVLIEMPLIHFFEGRKSAIAMVRIGTVLLAISFALLAWPDAGMGIAILFMTVLTLGEIVNFPFGNTFVLARTQVHNRGRYMGLYSMAWSISHIVAPVLGTWLAETLGFQALWGIMALISLGSIALIWTIQAPEMAPPT